jgi:hypothetical protein
MVGQFLSKLRFCTTTVIVIKLLGHLFILSDYPRHNSEPAGQILNGYASQAERGVGVFAHDPAYFIVLHIFRGDKQTFHIQYVTLHVKTALITNI